MHRKYILLLLTTLIGLHLTAQSSEIFHKIEKLQVLGTALYVAAHPDDENTRMISHLSNDRKVRTVYLSLTRGDGGQNLIGSELGAELGLIRTQELLAARGIDGGEQFFSRANDFGYSKTPEETLEIWENEKVLADVVWAIRKFKPDVIINRFNHERTRRTHGHHTASAMLSYEAFDMCGDRSVFPEQLDYVEPWDPKRLYFNTSWWFYGSREKFAEADKANMAEVDVGTYYPVLGESNNEVAARSRSMHKCQGFGARLQRGSQMEYLELLLGEKPEEKDDIFNGIDISWSRVEGGVVIGEMIDDILRKFDVRQPSDIVPDLVSLRNKISSIKDEHWKEIKLRDLDEIIIDCLGLYNEAYSSQEEFIPFEPFEWTMEWVNRSDIPVTVSEITPRGITLDTQLNFDLKENTKIEMDLTSEVVLTAPTTPYWINDKATLGMYYVEDQSLIGLPELPSGMGVDVILEVAGEKIRHFVPLVHKHVDPVKGEVTNAAPVSTGLSMSFDEDITIFRQNSTKTVSVMAKAYKETNTSIELVGDAGWKIMPDTLALTLSPGQTQMLEFEVTAPENAVRTEFVIRVVNSEEPCNQEIRIEYDHIPTQQIIRPAKAEFISSDIRFPDVRIGYIEGAGDKVDESLRQVGYNIQTVPVEGMTAATLDAFDVIIVGIRAFNTVDELRNANRYLFDFAENGGTLILQYNTRHRLVTQEISPIPLELSRDRVTDENSPVAILLPDHPVLNTPNKISLQDFDGWVQERGLYFPSEWDERFAAPLSMHDPGEESLTSSLLVAPYGRGYYVYSGLSWFRELPAGVEGAYKLFANLLALKQADRP